MSDIGGSKIRKVRGGFGFGLPSLDKASNTLENTGEKVEDLFFGHSKKHKEKNGLSIGVPGFGGASMNTHGQQHHGSSLSGSFNKIGGDLDKAGSALEKTGEETIDYIFGGSHKKIISPKETTRIPGLSLPSLSSGGTSPRLGGTFNKIGGDLNKAGGALEKTGKDTVNYLFGKSNKKIIAPTETTRIPGVSLPSLSLGGTGSRLGGTLNKIGGDLNKAGSALEKTGEKTVDYLFGKSKKNKIDATETIHKPAVSLPSLPLGGTGPRLSGTFNKIGGDLNKAGSALEKTGGETIDYLFGKSNKKIISPTETTRIPGFSLPSLSSGGNSSRLGGDLNKTGSALEKTGKETVNYLFGKSNNKIITPTGTSRIPALSLPSLPGLSDVGKKVNKDVGKIGSKVEKTGEKVVDYIFGKGKPTAPNEKLDLFPGKKIGTSASTLPSLSIGGTHPNLSGGENITEKAVLDRVEITRNPEGHPKTTIKPIGLDGKLLDVGGKINMSKNTSSPGISNVTKKMPDDLGTTLYDLANNVTTSSTTVRNDSGQTPVDLLGRKQSTSPNIVASENKNIPSPNSDSGISNTTPSLKKNEGTISTEIRPNKNVTERDRKLEIPPTSNLQANVVNVTPEGNQVTTFKEDSSRSPYNTKTEELTTGMPVSVGGTEDGNNTTFESNISSSLEKVANGVTDIPEKPITKSDEALKKIEDILKGSGKVTTINPPTATEENNKVKDQKVSERPNLTSTRPTDSTYTKVSDEDSTTVSSNTESKTTTSKPVVLPPYFLVPNSNSTLGKQFTPKLPPTIFDQPTGEKAPFIPILPPDMNSAPGNSVVPPNKATPAVAPPPAASPSGGLTPVEYGAIGVGAVLIFAIIACIYRKYREYMNSSSGGSYSPNSNRRSMPARKRSTTSNDGEGGQSQDRDEVDKTSTAPVEVERINAEMVVVEMTPEAKPVEETPITKTVVNGLHRSSSNENRQTLVPPVNPDSVEVLSETQKSKSALEKPPRRSRTPVSSPEKFTSDKTSASNMNESSLKTVGHAIGGILKSQEPNKNETENQTTGQQPESESSGESGEEGISLLGKIAGVSALKNPSDDSNEDTRSDEPVSNKPNSRNEMPVHVGPSENEPLYKSLENEVDAGSEYFSADENSDTKNSPPLSPIPTKEFEIINIHNLRAEDVYNTEIITEDGRRRSIEEDIAESIEKNKGDDNTLSHEEGNESLQPSAPISPPEVVTANNQTLQDFNGSEINQEDIPRGIHIRNLINAGKNVSKENGNEEAEAIVNDIIKTSCLDSLTIHSIRQDLGNSESSTIETPRVRWSDNVESRETEMNINSESEGYIGNNGACDPHTWTRTQIDVHPNKPRDFLKEVIHTAEPETAKTTTQNIHQNSNDSSKMVDETVVVLMNNANIQEAAKNTIKADYHEGALVNTASNVHEDESNVEPTPQPANQGQLIGGQNGEPVDEGFATEHRFEFIPPRQPQIFEDDLIVFANSDQESISTFSNSTPEGSRNEDVEGGVSTDSNRPLSKDEGGMSMNEFISETSRLSSNDLTEPSKNIEEKLSEQNRTKWYVPNDEVSDPDLINVEEKDVGSLYIVLTDDASNLEPKKDSEASKSLSNQSDTNGEGSPNKPKIEKRNYSNISYAYIDVNDDPRNEGWPKHLPKNIHSISGIGLVRTADVSSSLNGVLKEEEGEMIPSTSECGNVPKSTGSYSETVKGTQKPIPKFIIPNMDARLTKKRASRRRQIKSLDSGVHHYYGEYLNLVELPEIESEHETKKDEIKKKEDGNGDVIEEVLTIKPDGTITEEKIVIQNSQ